MHSLSMEQAKASGRIKEVFRRYDADGDGTISRQELRRVLQALGNFGDKGIDATFTSMDSNKDGMIQYSEFVDWLFDDSASRKDLTGDARREQIHTALRSCVMGGSSIATAMDDLGIDIALDGEEDEFTDVLSGLKLLSAKELREVFKSADVDRSGHIQLGELQSLLFPKAALQCNLTVAKVFAQMDRSKDGKVSCGEFVAFILDRKKKLSAAGFSQGASAEDKKRIAAAFSAGDTDGSGALSLEELQRSLCCETDEEREIVRRSFEALDSNGDGTLSVVEFAKMYGQDLVQESKGIEVEWKEVPSEVDSDSD